MSDKQEPLRLVHVITGLARGGAEGRLVKLVAELPLPRVEHSVAVLTPALDLAPALERLGVTVVPLGMQGVLSLPLAVRRLARVLRERRAQVVQSWLWHADLVATLAVRLVRPRPALAWFLCGSDVDMRHYPTSTALTVAGCARLSHLPELVLSNSRTGLEAHLGIGYRPRRSAVLPNGYDLARFRPDPEAGARLRVQFGWAPETEVIGMFARAAPMKDHATLFSALSRLVPLRPRLRCLVVGTQTETLALPPELAAAVRCIGAVAEPAPLLAGLDVNVLSSAFGEGSPNILGEAMAVGVPSVATDVGDCRAALIWEGGEAGRIVPSRDPDALAEAIRSLLDLSPEARGALGAAGHARVTAEFGIGAVASRHERVWRAAASGTLDALPEFQQARRASPPPCADASDRTAPPS